MTGHWSGADDRKGTSRVKRACPGCDRVVAVRYAVQNSGGGKPRVRHKCPHGTWCIFGAMEGKLGWNWPLCHECRKERRAEYDARRDEGKP